MWCNHTHIWQIILNFHMSEHLQMCKASGGSTLKRQSVLSIVLTGGPDDLCGREGCASKVDTLLPFLGRPGMFTFSGFSSFF